jgi:hypothetical protein
MRATHRADWVGFAEAREIVLGAVSPLPAVRRALADALGHVLAEQIRSPLDLPPWAASPPARRTCAALPSPHHGSSVWWRTSPPAVSHPTPSGRARPAA